MGLQARYNLGTRFNLMRQHVELKRVFFYSV